MLNNSKYDILSEHKRTAKFSVKGTLVKLFVFLVAVLFSVHANAIDGMENSQLAQVSTSKYSYIVTVQKYEGEKQVKETKAVLDTIFGKPAALSYTQSLMSLTGPEDVGFNLSVKPASMSPDGRISSHVEFCANDIILQEVMVQNQAAYLPQFLEYIGTRYANDAELKNGETIDVDTRRKGNPIGYKISISFAADEIQDKPIPESK